MNLVRWKGVELASAGMNWPGSGGKITLRLDHLADMVKASEDPFVQPPRLKIGHEDPRFAEELPDHDPFYDGEPALGYVENLRLTNGGAKLVGDLVMPEWLGDVAEFAYPTRSIEGSHVEGRWGFATPGGNEYSLALTAVSLLGVFRPAVEDIADLQGFLTEGQGVEAVEGGVAARGKIEGMKLKADVDRVVEVFRAKFAKGERSKWWPRLIYSDPNEIIADDAEGAIHRVPFTSDEEEAVTFGDPVEVLQTFEDVPVTAMAAAIRGGPIAAFAARADVPGYGGSAPSGKNRGMDYAAALRKKLGLAEDATDEQIETALNAEETPAETQPETPPAEEAPEPPAEETPTETPAEEAPPAAKAGTVTMDAAAVEELKLGAADGRAAREEQMLAARSALVEGAIKLGKFPPYRREHYMALHAADPEGTEQMIANLAAGIIPVDERGTAKDEPVAAAAEVDDDFMRAHFGPAYAGGNS